jgi:hypothetical protein
MKLEFLMEYTATVRGKREVIGSGPLGTRVVADIAGGTCEGPRIRGKLLHSGADWFLQDDRGVARLDVRGPWKRTTGRASTASTGAFRDPATGHHPHRANRVRPNTGTCTS